METERKEIDKLLKDMYSYIYRNNDNPPSRKETIKTWLQRYDENNDRKLDFEELKTMVLAEIRGEVKTKKKIKKTSKAKPAYISSES